MFNISAFNLFIALISFTFYCVILLCPPCLSVSPTCHACLILPTQPLRDSYVHEAAYQGHTSDVKTATVRPTRLVVLVQTLTPSAGIVVVVVGPHWQPPGVLVIVLYSTQLRSLLVPLLNQPAASSSRRHTNTILLCIRDQDVKGRRARQENGVGDGRQLSCKFFCFPFRRASPLQPP